MSFSARHHVNRIRGAWMILLLAALAALPAHAAVTLDANFDTGSLKSYTVSGTTVNLVGRSNYGSDGTWKTLFFKVSGAQGQKLTFVINNRFQSGSSRLTNWDMVFSYDGYDWQFFDNNVHDSTAATYTFFDNTAFTQDTVYVATGLVYRYADAMTLTADMLAEDFGHPTARGNAQGVIGYSPGGVDDIGRTITPKAIPAFKITDARYWGNKKKIVLTSGNHPNEFHGGQTLEGMVRFIASDDPRAVELRQICEFYVYPMSNPDGRWAGMNRTNVQFQSRDYNRYWWPTLFGDMQDLKAVCESMYLDTGGNIDYFIDFHSWTNTDNHFMIVQNSAQVNHPYRLAISAREPSLYTSTGMGQGVSGYYGTAMLNADFSMIQETKFKPGELVPRYRDLGKNFALALHDVLWGTVDTTGSKDWHLYSDAEATAPSDHGHGH